MYQPNFTKGIIKTLSKQIMFYLGAFENCPVTILIINGAETEIGA